MLAQQWHPTKNGDRRPEGFTAGSSAKLWWLCPTPCSTCGKAHEWEARISNRAKAGNPSGCPFCGGQRICRCNSLAATQPELMAQWDHAGNEGLDPSQISLYSNRKLSWVCTQHGTWLATVEKRAFGNGCPDCAQENNSRNAVKRGLLKDEHSELVAQLHPTKNKHIDSEKVTSGSNKKAVWVCPDRQNAPLRCSHAHEWSARICDRTGGAKREGSGCPYCHGRLVCPCNSLAVRAPEVAAQWHPTRNGDKGTDQIAAYSNIKGWWQHTSEVTGELHEWKAKVENRVRIRETEGRLSCRQCFNEMQKRLITRSPSS